MIQGVRQRGKQSGCTLKLHRTEPPLQHPIIVYSLALAAVVAAVALRWLLDPILGSDLELVTLFGYVAAAVWLGGYRPAIVVVALGYAACAYLFIDPRNSFDKGEARHLVGLVLCLGTCAIIIAFGEVMRRARLKAEVGRETLQVMLSSIGDAVIATDTENRVVLMNPVAESLTGWSQSEAASQPLDIVFRIVNEETRLSVENPARQALQEGSIVGLANPTILICKDGREVAVDDSAAPIRNRLGEIVGCVLIFRNISERRQTEKRLARELSASRFLASIVESSEDAIITKTLDGFIQTWNDAAQRLFGYSEEQIIGKHISYPLNC